MLDIKFIRENADLVREAARKKRIDFKVDELLKADDERRKLIALTEGKRNEQKNLSRPTAGEEISDSRRQSLKALKLSIEEEEKNLKEVTARWQQLMLSVPNIPDISVPEGESDGDNKEIKTWGEKPQFGFKAKNHVDLMLAHNMVDFERGAKVAGFRGYFLKNDGALLSFAIWQYALEFFGKRGFTPMLVPSLVRKENLLGTGFIPQGEEDLYKTQDGEYLAGTAEVATMGYLADETIPKEKLPLKYLCFSPCFRREAGSHGKDVRGLIRVHEFFKWEQVIICEASHEESVKWHEWLNRNTEEFVESLGIPYRTVLNCGADLGLGQVKKYDIELWVPLEEKYREISSASYFHDFQTRRLGIRYKVGDEKPVYAHSLNSTAAPTPRLLVSLVENFQQADGSIKVPEVLQKYLGKNVIN
jgi:seryl-tRNA synthetase